ncbi:hypothetical protein BGZ60DRAFT_398064 [Tricladium varicosporioides]|nr:hypothetical protein BGZ60DRAFT_398064 [Hymenoscyphus varicosporioides]
MFYTKSIFIGSVLGFLSLGEGSPLQLTPRQDVTYNTTMITYIADDTCGGSGITLPGTVTSGQCLRFKAWSYKIVALPDRDCTFTTYNSATCGSKGLDTVYPVPAGNGSVCAFGGAYDGGLHYIRSGIYNCI